MKTIEVEKKDLNPKEWIKYTAKEEHSNTLITEDTLITYQGKPIILYKVLEDRNNDLRWALNTIKYSKTDRTSGLKTISTIFGYSPRIAIRNDFCSATAMARTHPKQHYVITQFAQKLTCYYKKYFPKVYENHIKETQTRISPDWTIPQTPFTSGIVNCNNELKYHLDSGNFKNVLSNMVVFKSGIRGGYLVCPEYDLKFEVADNTLMIFDGQSIIHGVSKIKKTHSKANRYSIVYYTLEQMCKCLPIQEEVKRIREVKKKKELRRLEL